MAVVDSQNKVQNDIDIDGKLTIMTLGSHCSLQVLKGAKDEGFETLLVCDEKRVDMYKRFKFIDHLISVKSFNEITNADFQTDLITRFNPILIPHGTLISTLDMAALENIKIPIFGNKWILRWESDRVLKQQLMNESDMHSPIQLESKHEIDGLCIVKLHGAAGGKGYFLVTNRKEFEDQARLLIESKTIRSEEDLFIQKYANGVPVYLQYFYSPINNELELLGIDRRYETDIDAIGRIPSKYQLSATIEPSYTVVGNIPIVLRESLLPEVYSMGERFVNASRKLVPPGIPGPFCIEGVYDNNANFTAFEFSARIVAGTNLYISGSPYSDLLYDVPMSMGRRIALEINKAKDLSKIELVTT
ncbi:formate--phosphoribosylaminoimidazolecarboxamide ligase [Candidatus Nitrosocosmicus franklandus]|uniref:5-formaminoimidazole-4-carboxamide-1-(beta)-D-ribofuranosyl 5'-monophosphate synthetase n=1 Tax=Candidatus Nitrosocosmicus franklandianus TaxID=1798806 RepID=A0A484I899_9ARCH|nr:formate--phosphoribosylaminoimidazolecarboxamide ligase [Candidatus Nitrosocosmicus franklandus]VFJ13326.1 5-formaminoimidazole-4-carboxamide-1-(beta)-D-ribofuranosyl 5'-monophosphate synthetase [Candidatus Nitrosocosmicus franklandus]